MKSLEYVVPDSEWIDRIKMEMVTEGELWAEPIPLPSENLPAFPLEAFRRAPWLHNMVAAVAKSVQVPVDLPAVAALAALSACVRGKFEFQLAPDWISPTNLYLLSISPPSSGKSAVMRHMITRPIVKWTINERALKAAEIQEREAEREFYERRLKKLKRDIAKIEDKVEQQKAIKELADVKRQVVELNRPLVARILIDDCTPARMFELMQENGPMSAIIDESPLLDNIFGVRHRGAADTGLLCKGWSGDRAGVDRIRAGVSGGKETVRAELEMERPCLTLAMFIQESPIRAVASSHSFRGQGFAARLLPSIPEDLLGQRNTRRRVPVPLRTQEAYREKLFELLSLEWNGKPYRLVMSSEAEEEWFKFCDKVEPALDKRDGILGHIRDWGGRARDQAARVAALLHIAEVMQTREPHHAYSEPVSRETVKIACDLVWDYFRPHALELFDMLGMSNPEEQEHARSILQWLRKLGAEGKLPETINRRFVCRSGPSCFRGSGGVDKATQALAVLEELMWIRSLPKQPNSSQNFEVHPRLSQGLSHPPRTAVA